MANPSEPPKFREALPGASKQSRLPILPTVFIRSPTLTEPLHAEKENSIPNIPFSRLIEDITKKCGELREHLAGSNSILADAQPFSVREAELVLRNAERLLPTLPAGQSSLAPDAAHELKYRAVDALLMLDAANRALGAP